MYTRNARTNKRVNGNKKENETPPVPFNIGAKREKKTKKKKKRKNYVNAHARSLIRFQKCMLSIYEYTKCI